MKSQNNHGVNHAAPVELELMKLNWRERRAPRTSVLIAWICGMAAGGMVALTGFLTTPAVDPLVLRNLPFRAEFVVIAGALAAAVPARMLRASGWQSLLLGIAGAFLTLTGVEFVFLVGPDPSRLWLGARRELAATILGMVLAATFSANLIARFGRPAAGDTSGDDPAR